MIQNCLTTKYPPYDFGSSDLHTYTHGSIYSFEFTYKEARLHFINCLINNLYSGGEFRSGFLSRNLGIKLNKENVPEITFMPAY